MSFKELRLGDIVEYSKVRCNIEDVTRYNYISTENMLPDKAGITESSGLPNSKTVSKYNKEDILISNIRPYFKKIWYADKIGGASNDVLIFNVDKKNADSKYVYYCLNQDTFFDYVMKTSKGTKMPRGDKTAILNFDVKLPPIEEQIAIAKILSDLDNKIEVNNKINKRLEDMAQSIFKHWFVDFEFPNEEGKPYKSSGGEMVESELGMIPKGWELKELGELSNIVGGGTPSTKIEEYYNGDIPWITPKDLSGYDRKFIKKGSRSITQLGLDKSSAKVLPRGSVLFSSRAPIGYISIAENMVTTNQGFKSIDCSEGKISNNYVYYTLINQLEDIKNNATGSTFKEISGLFMKKLKVILPNENILNKFEIIIQSIDLELKKNYKEIDRLMNLRDILLPKLMSGEIRVPFKK